MAPLPNNHAQNQRLSALERFQLIRPFLEEGIALTQVAKSAGIALRTARRWVTSYRRDGFDGLCRKPRIDKGTERLSKIMQEIAEGFALEKPRLSVATIHRKLIVIAAEMGELSPSYNSIYQHIRRLDPGLLTIAHEGTKVYSQTFDLLHRHEAEMPNAIWQADHSQLDIWLIDERGQGQKPWLTIILDDYSRAIAGYFVFFSAPSALQTSLALRQAVWRKTNPAWHICGIPSVLYTDHGSDFTSQHIEQVSAELKIQLVFSTVGKPRGRGKIERFFETLAQLFLSQLPGYAPSGHLQVTPKLTLSEFTQELERFLIHQYNKTPHSTTEMAPQTRWEQGGFLPQMPQSLEQLDLLLLTVAKGRRIHRDGIRFQGLRYIDLTMATYVGEEVIIRYDPRDMAEIRVYYKNKFLCRAVCQELAGQTVGLKQIIQARDKRRRQLQRTVRDRKALLDLLVNPIVPSEKEESNSPTPSSYTFSPLKRYIND